jgi:hypothetical protein
MTEPAPPPPIPRPVYPPPPAASGPPLPYRRAGLIPAAGPARTWGLAVIGAPLLLILLLGLIIGHGGGDSNSAAPEGRSVGFGSGTSAEPQLSAAPYSPSVVPEFSSAPDPATASGTTPPDDFFGAPPSLTTATGSATPGTSSGPQAVVTAYFAAINQHDYRTAWAMGGKTFTPDYDAFAAGFATTEQDNVSSVSVQGSVVHFSLNAVQTDGTSRSYDAAFTVSGGEITDGTVTPTT